MLICDLTNGQTNIFTNKDGEVLDGKLTTYIVKNLIKCSPILVFHQNRKAWIKAIYDSNDPNIFLED